MTHHYHFIGIGGIGMSALARIVKQQGCAVQGSEKGHSSLTCSLQEEGIAVLPPHDNILFTENMAVIFGSAISTNHPEYVKALSQKKKVLHRSDLLQQLMQEKTALLVAGTHGKTSTTALLIHTLITANIDPSYALGGILHTTSSNGSHGQGSLFVAEADESDGTFIKYSGFAAIITNVEEEHLPFWKNKEELVKGFKQFAANISNHLMWCYDDEALRCMQLKGMSYGFSLEADICITRFVQERWSQSFDLVIQGIKYIDIQIPLIGKHQVLNAAAVFGLSLLLGIQESVIRHSFNTFRGVKRRMEKKGDNKGVQIFDDYAHHPTEIKTTLLGLKRAAEERRVVVVFEPHRFSRLQQCWSQFLEAFDLADALFITDVEAAGEEPIEGIDGPAFAREIQKKVQTPVMFASKEELLEKVGSYLRPHDICITLGAGPITRLSEQLLDYPIRPFSALLIQGGVSAEHEVSILSAKMIQKELNPFYYDLKTVTISKEGKWFCHALELTVIDVAQLCLQADVVFPILHGPFGEDGSLQGFLEMLGIPYVGCDFRSCVVSMDKAFTKHIARSCGIAVAPFKEYEAHDWLLAKERVEHDIVSQFSYPFYIKAVHLGSTFGVFKIQNSQEIAPAIESVCQLDYKFLVEEEVVGREIEFSVTGGANLQISQGAEVIKNAEIHTYENKYSLQGQPAILKAFLPPLVEAEGKAISERIYKAVGCSGLARIDFFLSANGQWIFNEINPMPGFTPMSVYPLVWKAEGFKLSDIIDQIMVSSLCRFRNQRKHLKPPCKPPIDL